MNRAVALLLLAGCPGAVTEPTEPEPTPEPTEEPTPVVLECVDDPEAGVSDGACTLEERVGGFIVDDQADFTVISGQVYDSVNPQGVLEVVVSEGDCALLGRPVHFCDPPCASGEVCNGDTCVPYPSSIDLGTVVISGLDTCVEMEPVQPGNNYSFTNLGYPGMVPADPVRLDSADLQLHAAGVEPIVFPDGDWVMAEGTPLPITWTAQTVGDSRVAVSMSIDQHGATPLRLDCLFDDDGEGTVPASVIDQLIASGVTGFPSASIKRLVADSVTLDGGCVDLVVSSSRPHGLDVDGFTPCSRPGECPEPQVCDLMNEICVDP